MNNDHHKPDGQQTKKVDPPLLLLVVGLLAFGSRWIVWRSPSLSCSNDHKLRFDVVHNGRLYIFQKNNCVEIWGRQIQRWRET
jgi:hypothetical protein